MGGGEASGDGPEQEQEQEQEQKRAAAAAYDYEGDARWEEYWSNVLVPPHLASRPDVVDHFKRKFYQRYIDRDLVVEPLPSIGSTQPSRPEVRSSSSTSSENVRARNSGSSSRSAAPPPPPPQTDRAANPLRFDGRTIHFSINAWVLVVAGLGMLPILPKHLADRACKLSLLGTLFSSGYSLYTTYGIPREWNMPAIQGWLQSVLGAKDFLHLMFSLMLFTSQLHLKIAALPVFCWALDHVARFLRRNFTHSSFYRGYLEEPCLWVETNNTTLSLLSSNAEIALGFLLIISLFSWRRSIIQTFMYWQKAIEQIAVVGEYHRQLLELRQERDELCKQAERWLKSDTKILADSLDYEKEESRKLKAEAIDALKKLKEANSATIKAQENLNKKEYEMQKLRNEVREKTMVIQEITRISKGKDQEVEKLSSRMAEITLDLKRLEKEINDKTSIYEKTVCIAKKNAEDLRSWEKKYAEAVTSHGEEVKKLDSQLVEQVVEIKKLREASTHSQQEMESMKVKLQGNITLLNNVLGELHSEGKSPRDATIAALASTIGNQVGTLHELVTTLKANQAESIKDAVETAVSYALAKLKAHDPNLNVQPIDDDFDCPEAEARRLMGELLPAGRKVSEEMQLGSPSSD